MQKLINRIIYVFLIGLVILSNINYVLATNETQVENNISTNSENTTNSTNEVKTLTLEEQQQNVKDAIQNASIQLDYVNEELSSTIVEIQELDDKILKYQNSLDNVNSKYGELQEKVEESEKELQNCTDSYNKKDRLLKQRLTELYKRGKTTYLDVLLSSRDVLEFISNYFVIKEIAEYDTKDLQEMADTQKKLEKINNKLQEDKTQMRLTKLEAEKQSVILQNTKTIYENYKNSLTDSEQEINSKIETYKKQEEEINQMKSNAITSSTYQLQYSNGEMLWPTLQTSYITSPFGSRLHPIQGIIKNHNGIDIGGKTGNPIYAAKDGVIIYSSWMSGYGNTTMIDHGTNDQGVKIVTLYGHGNKLLKQVGEYVKKGDQIMEMGSTGNSTGPHVHFEVSENGVPVDPKKYLSN